MKVSELGEFGLIERLKLLIEQKQPAPAATPTLPRTGEHRLLLGIGDDCAVWQEGAETIFTKTDTMVEGVHFTRETASWGDIGWKALAVNLSDIASMGGIPGHALITLGLPGDTPVEGLDELYRGMLDCATAYPTALAGGDIVASPILFVTIAIIGRTSGLIPFPNNALLRSAARPGDAIAVTGHVGSSAAGLRLLQSGEAPENLAFALDAHRRPTPRLEVGRLALDAGLRCGMDVSDGIVADLSKLCMSAHVCARIQVSYVPVQESIKAAFSNDWQQMALTGGEDYELLLTGPTEVIDAVRERTDVPITIIGRIEDGEPGKVIVLDEKGQPMDVGAGGWDHLARA